MFPQLVAGPIVRARDILDQIKNQDIEGMNMDHNENIYHLLFDYNILKWNKNNIMLDDINIDYDFGFNINELISRFR